MKKTIKLFDPYFGNQEEETIKKILHSHFWASGSGTGLVSKFEKSFRNYIGTGRCVAVNSGTAALHLALSLFDIKNKEVILPSLSFVSTAHAVVYNGGKPIFVDIEPETLCIDPKKIKKSISKKTKILLPVHFGGLACNLKEIMEICDKSNITLIEDAAHASGSSYKNKKIGNHGTCVCFSFHPVKNLAMPTGGAIMINGKKRNMLEKILKSLRWCGITDRNGPKYNVEKLGWNYYMNEFSAGIGLEQLNRLDRMNSKRKKIAKRYSKEIKIEEKMPFDQKCSYHLYWIRVKNRDKFMKNLIHNQIETGIHYLPIHKMKFYKSKLKLPNTEKAAEKIVSIPIHPNLSDIDVSKIIKLVNRFA